MSITYDITEEEIQAETMPHMRKHDAWEAEQDAKHEANKEEVPA